MPIKSEDVADIAELLEQLFKAKIDERGRVYIPKVVREKLSLKLGDRIYLKIENGHFIAYSLRAIKRRWVQIQDTYFVATSGKTP